MGAHRPHSAGAVPLERSARIVEALPNALYRVELDPTRERLTAHVQTGALLRLLPGEDVVVEITPYDTTRARIVRRKG